MNIRTIVVKRDGLDYIEIATKPTLRQKIAAFLPIAAQKIDKVLFYGADISSIPAPRKDIH